MAADLRSPRPGPAGRAPRRFKSQGKVAARQRRRHNFRANKKVGHDWHHHSRALRRRSMGQGGITGCREDAQGT